MQRVEKPMETIHLYVVREEEPRPSSLLPLFWAFLCLLLIVAVTVYSGDHPSLEQQTLRVPAILLPLRTFTTSVNVIPTGVKTYPATYATGILMITNGSIAAHVVTSDINIPPLAINQVIGTSLYVRNLSPFTGGRKAFSDSFTTPQDRSRAVIQARHLLFPSTLQGLLFTPCTETIAGNVTLTWRCQFVTYHVPSFMKVIRVRIQERQLLVEVVYVAPHQPFRGK